MRQNHNVVFLPVVNLEVILGGGFLDVLHWNERKNCFSIMPLSLYIHDGMCPQSRADIALLPLHTPCIQLSEVWHKVPWVWSLSPTFWAGVKIQLFVQFWHSAWVHYSRHRAFVRPKQSNKHLLDCSAPLSTEKKNKKEISIWREHPKFIFWSDLFGFGGLTFSF